MSQEQADKIIAGVKLWAACVKASTLEGPVYEEWRNFRKGISCIEMDLIHDVVYHARG